MNSSGIVVRTWNDAPIGRRDSDGYADATAMCQANGKDWFDYQRLGRTTEYITALAGATGLQPAQLVITTTTGPNHLRGTWIHPRLAVDLARWISPAFAVWMDGWFLEATATPQLPQPEPQQLTLGVKVCARDRRQATDLWREAVKREVVSALNRSLGTTGLRSAYPPLVNCDWIEAPAALGVDQVRSVLPCGRPVTTAAILSRLNLSDNRCNQMAVAAVLRHLGYARSRHMIAGQRHWLFTPDPCLAGAA
jgi:hypothetical protein